MLRNIVGQIILIYVFRYNPYIKKALRGRICYIKRYYEAYHIKSNYEVQYIWRHEEVYLIYHIKYAIF